MKRSSKHAVVCACATLALSLTTSVLAVAAESPPEPQAATAPADDGRFRFGVAGGAGLMSWDGPTFWYGGVDLRFGYQINDLIGVYAQPQLGVYGGDAGAGLVGTGGLIGTSAVVDFTFVDQFFVGGGLGYAILNNPSGVELHLRVGGYPVYGDSKEKARRKGLMLGADLRLHFVEGYTFVAPTFNIGYEAY
jgi:hypothetical protein